MATRVTGLTSGLDTEALVSAMVMNYRAKADKTKQAQTSLQYKLDALKSVNTEVYSFFQSADKLRWSSAYNIRSATVSDPTKAKVSAGDGAVNGSQILEIKELAQAGYLTGGKVSSAGALSSDTKLSDIYTGSGSSRNSFSGGSITVTVDGTEKNIELSGDMTARDLTNRLKEAGLNASFDAGNGRFFISSKKSGADSDFKLVANNSNGLDSLKALGLYIADTDSISEYQKWADYENKSVDDWNTFVDEQYASRVIKPEDRAASYASQYNTAISNLSKAQTDAKAVFDTLTEAEQLQFTSAEKMKEKAEALKAQKEADKDTLTEDDIKALDEQITKFESAAEKLTGYEKTIADSKAKMTELAGKVNVELNDMGEPTKATALTSSDANFATIEAEVETDNINARQALSDSLKDRVAQSKAMLASMNAGDKSEGAFKIKGQDAKIILNDAEFTSSTNNFSINGLSIEATAKTNGAVTINTSTDTQGLYDKIKDFFSQYNDVMAKMSKLYNAPSAKGYNPLTEDQKKEMSESEVNLWETKVKDSILRRDGTLSGIMSVMQTAMGKTFDIGGQSYSLASFGIKTAGYFSSDQTNRYALHIDGDADDKISSGNADKLMAAIMAEPEKVGEFFQKLSNSVYDALNAKMKSSSLSSAYTIYNDKEMASEYSDYTKTVSKWQDQVSSMEDYYYKKYAAMEATLTKLQSQTSQLSSYFG